VIASEYRRAKFMLDCTDVCGGNVWVSCDRFDTAGDGGCALVRRKRRYTAYGKQGITINLNRS
jgi:hypothetical protein